MKKYSKALRAASWILRKPSLLNKVLTDDELWQRHVTKKYGFTGGLPVVYFNQLSDLSTISLSPITFLDGGSLPTDLMLLSALAEKITDCRYFEIGTWRGESAACVASRAKNCTTLYLTDEEMRAMGMDEIKIRSHALFSKSLKNVCHIRGNSLHYNFASLEQKFDLIFIDGNHHFEYIVSDTRNVFEHLVHEESIVVWHDYAHHPDKIRFEVMAAILEGAGASRIQNIYHVAHTKCAIYANYKLESSNVEFPVIPKEFYDIQITPRKI